MKDARSDPRWQEAQAAYIADYPDLDPDEAMGKRIAAAVAMYEIEREYKPTLRPAVEVLADAPHSDDTTA